jgi:transcriptional regulator with XRE-family HTH domain
MAAQLGEFYEALGKAIYAARHDAGLTQAELASALGLSRPSIVNIERGRQGVQVHLLVQIAEIVGHPVADLISLARARPSGKEPERKLEGLDPSKRRWAEQILADDSDDSEARSGR